MHSGWAGGNGPVLVPRRLLQQVVTDGCCPLDLRLQLLRALTGTGYKDDGDCHDHKQLGDNVLPMALGDDVFPMQEGMCGPFEGLGRHCLSAVAANLPLSEVLAVRACNRESLQWAMQRGTEESDPRHWVHNRIRARLWMRRVADLTNGTRDESVFETQMQSLADEALRSRMEAEMHDALALMEDQIRTFQADVDRRLEEQETHVRRLVEERVQQELNNVLASEIVKVQTLVEERVRERVSSTFRREVRETVRELMDKLDALVKENELLRDAFAEANLRAKSMFWALNPSLFRTANAASLGLGGGVLFSVGRRMALASACHGALICLEGFG